MPKKCKVYLIWFVAGMAVQLIANVLAQVSFMSRPILFCLAAGFLILVAVGLGMWIGGHEEPKPKSYKQWAEVPIDD